MTDLPEARSLKPEAGLPRGHTRFQIDHFIVTKGNWLPWGKLKQCRREIDGRARALLDLADELESAELDLRALPRGWRWLTRRRNAITRRQLARRIESIRQSIADTERELKRFRELASGCEAELGPIDEARALQLDAEWWDYKARVYAACNLLTRGGLDQGTLELILSLPDEMRERIVADTRATIEALHARQDGPLTRWLLQGPARAPGGIGV